MQNLCLNFLTLELLCKKFIDLLLFILETLLFIKQSPLRFISGNTWWSTKVGAKLLSDLAISSMFSSDRPLYFRK